MNIIFTIGISGAGKSTWVKEFLAAHPDYICINRDTLRLCLVRTLVGYYDRPDVGKLEAMVNALVDTSIDIAQRFKYNVLVDNTNLHSKYITSFIAEADTWQFKLFDCNPTIAKTRVLLRDVIPSSDRSLVTEDYINTVFSAKVSYIDEQYKRYIAIKEYVLTHYPKNNYNK